MNTQGKTNFASREHMVFIILKKTIAFPVKSGHDQVQQVIPYHWKQEIWSPFKSEWFNFTAFHEIKPLYRCWQVIPEIYGTSNLNQLSPSWRISWTLATCKAMGFVKSYLWSLANMWSIFVKQISMTAFHRDGWDIQCVRHIFPILFKVCMTYFA